MSELSEPQWYALLYGPGVVTVAFGIYLGLTGRWHRRIPVATRVPIATTMVLLGAAETILLSLWLVAGCGFGEAGEACKGSLLYDLTPLILLAWVICVSVVALTIALALRWYWRKLGPREGAEL